LRYLAPREPGRAGPVGPKVRLSYEDMIYPQEIINGRERVPVVYIHPTMSNTTSARFPASIALIATVASAIGCGTARRDALVARPLHRPTSQVELGERIFTARCNQCHPGGAAGLGPAVNNKPVPGFMIAFQVRHGLGAMPRFSKSQLSDRQLDAVIAYLKDLRNRPVSLAKSS